jgi:hypothetical protein
VDRVERRFVQVGAALIGLPLGLLVVLLGFGLKASDLSCLFGEALVPLHGWSLHCR